jgi:NlpE-like protein
MQGGDRGIVALRLAPAGSARYGAFEGKVPCQEPCQKIKVALTLHQDARDQSPTRYLLERVYGGQGNDRHVSQGAWNRAASPRFGAGSLVHLDGDSPEEFRHYLAVGENLLLILDKDGEPKVGNAAYSFTLSRTHLE